MPKTTYVLDCGVNQSTLFNSKTKEVIRITHDEVLELHKRLEPNSTLICEYAHLGCDRKPLSLSQPFTSDELKQIYNDLEKNSIKLKLFPQQSTPRACAYSGLPKLDDNDPVSIYNLVQDFPEISMMNPPKDFKPSKKREWSWRMKDQVNYTLNLARRYKYLDEDDKNTEVEVLDEWKNDDNDNGEEKKKGEDFSNADGDKHGAYNQNVSPEKSSNRESSPVDDDDDVEIKAEEKEKADFQQNGSDVRHSGKEYQTNNESAQVTEVKEEENKEDEDKKKDEKPVKTEKTFKVERTERSKMISQLKQEYGNSFNPFKILGITASQETPELVKKKCRELRLKEHPDKGGDKEKFDMIQKACDVLMRTQTPLKKKKKGN